MFITLSLRFGLRLVMAFALWFAGGGLVCGQTVDSPVGAYRRLPVENPWHEGTIAIKPGSDGKMLEWQNKAGVKWNLTPDLAKGVLYTDQTNPYFKNGATQCTLELEDGRIIGFVFNGDVYHRDLPGGPAVRLPQKSGGLKGYISMSLGAVPPEYGAGVSFYVATWPLLAKPLAGFQIGLPSTWISPDNHDFTQPLCPPGTRARDNWPERGPYYRDVFQTIEGGLGFWVSTQFPSGTPKYRINGTLTDGSVVTYAWYRFIDQPSIMALKWSDAERSALQAMIEQFHAQWTVTGDYLPAPGSGKLTALDAALRVEPPKGLEVGYVPIVTRQAAKR